MQCRQAAEGQRFQSAGDESLEEVLRVVNPVIEEGISSMWGAVDALLIHGADKSTDKFSNSLCDRSLF